MIDQQQQQQLSSDAQKFLSLLDIKSKFPLPIHKKINEKIEGIARIFLIDICKEVRKFLVYSPYEREEDEDERTTKNEV